MSGKVVVVPGLEPDARLKKPTHTTQANAFFSSVSAMNRNHLLSNFRGIVLGILLILPFVSRGDDSDENSPAYRDAAARFVLSISMPFSIPLPESQEPALQIRKVCADAGEIVGQVYHGLIHFDLTSGRARLESFPFLIMDMTCGTKSERHLLASSWPDGGVYAISMKPKGAWSGWRRGDRIKVPNGEPVFGFVDDEKELRVLTSRHLYTLRGDAIVKSIALSQSLNMLAAARVSVVGVDNDIYFGNDGGEWGGTLYRIDKTTGKVSLSSEGSPVVAIEPDAEHSGCVLVARAVSHMGFTDGELMRACHEAVQTLLEKQPVWGIAGKNPTYVAFSDGVGELQHKSIVNRRSFPSNDQSVAGMHYATLSGVLLLASGISQSVSVSGAVPMLVELQGSEEAGPRPNH